MSNKLEIHENINDEENEFILKLSKIDTVSCPDCLDTGEFFNGKGFDKCTHPKLKNTKNDNINKSKKT